MATKQPSRGSVSDSTSTSSKKIQTNIATFRRISTHSMTEGYFDSGFIASPKAVDTEATAHVIKEILLPCFGNIGTTSPLEDLNLIVKKWAGVSSCEQILNDVTDILRIGMGVIAFKLQTTPIETFGAKLAEIWVNFNSNTVNTIEASLLPLKYHPKLMANAGGVPIDIRVMTLSSFSEYVIMPNKPRIEQMFRESEEVFAISSVTSIREKLMQLFGTLACLADVPDTTRSTLMQWFQTAKNGVGS